MNRIELPASGSGREGGVLRTGRLGTCVGTAVFSIVWYLILGAAGWSFFSDLRAAPAGTVDRAPLLIFGVLLLAGLVPLATAAKSFVRLFAPRLEIAMPRGGFARGTSARPAYRLVGDEREISEVRVDLVCLCVRTEPAGRNSRTVEEELLRLGCFRSARGHEFRRGEFAVEIPADAPAPTSGRRGRIEWRFEVRLERPGRTPVEDKCPVVVL